MRHIRELIALTETAHPSDRFFSNVDETMRLIPEARAQYGAYERALASLDRDSWQTLRAKAIAHFTDHRTGQRKQGFFNQLNDAFAYRHLVRQGYNDVRVLPEGTTTQPDIQYTASGELKFCEVKTISISDELIARRATPKVVSSAIYHQLQTGFLSKLQSTLSAASRQIAAKNANGLVYVIVHFDDFTLEHYPAYREQIASCLEAHTAAEVYVKVGLLGRKHLAKIPRRAGTCDA